MEAASYGYVLPIEQRSLIRLCSKHGSYLQATPLKEGELEADLSLSNDANAAGTEFLLQRERDGYFTLYSFHASAFVIATSTKAGWGGGYKAKLGMNFRSHAHVWKETKVRQPAGHCGLTPHGDGERSLVAGRLGFIPPRGGVAIKAPSRFQQRWNSWTHELCDDQSQVVAVEAPTAASEITGVPYVGDAFRNEYARFFLARPGQRVWRVVLVSPRSGQGKSSCINTLLERHEAHVSTAGQGQAVAEDHNLQLSDPANGTHVEWILGDTPGLSGRHDVPAGFFRDNGGLISPDKFARHYGLGRIDVDGIFLLSSLTRYDEEKREVRALLDAIRKEAPETPVVLIMTHADGRTAGLLSEDIKGELGAKDLPFFFVNTEMPASPDPMFTRLEHETHARRCREAAVRNKATSDFPALLKFLGMPVRGQISHNLIFLIYAREIVTQSLDQALESFKPTTGSRVLQLGAQIFMGPFLAAFVVFTTMSIANQACQRLGLVAYDDDPNTVVRNLGEDYIEINEMGVNSVFRKILRNAFFTGMPLILFDEIYIIAVDLGVSEVVGLVGGVVGLNVVGACVNAIFESDRWARIAAVIRHEAFKIHMQCVVADGEALWQG